MTDETVVPIRTGLAPRRDDSLAEFFSGRLAAFVEIHGIPPDCVVITMWNDQGEDLKHAIAFCHKAKSMGRPMAYGTAAALLLRASND